MTLLAVVAVASFFMGCSFKCCAGRLARSVGAFLVETLAPLAKPLTRTVGTMSQCTYSWANSVQRFEAEKQGFKRAGEVAIEL